MLNLIVNCFIKPNSTLVRFTENNIELNFTENNLLNYLIINC